jgi:hypothetical protein
VFVKTFWTRITSVFFLGRHYHRICHQLNIYGMNSVDMFTTIKIQNKSWTEIVMQYGGLWSSVECVTTSCSNDSFASLTHRTNQSLVCGMLFHSCTSASCSYYTLLNSTNLHTAWQFLSMICFDNDVEKFCWYCLICYAHMNLNYMIFVDFFLYVKNIEH